MAQLGSDIPAFVAIEIGLFKKMAAPKSRLKGRKDSSLKGDRCKNLDEIKHYIFLLWFVLGVTSKNSLPGLRS